MFFGMGRNMKGSGKWWQIPVAFYALFWMLQLLFHSINAIQFRLTPEFSPLERTGRHPKGSSSDAPFSTTWNLSPPLPLKKEVVSIPPCPPKQKFEFSLSFPYIKPKYSNPSSFAVLSRFFGLAWSGCPIVQHPHLFIKGEDVWIFQNWWKLSRVSHRCWEQGGGLFKIWWGGL